MRVSYGDVDPSTSFGIFSEAMSALLGVDIMTLRTGIQERINLKKRDQIFDGSLPNCCSRCGKLLQEYLLEGDR